MPNPYFNNQRTFIPNTLIKSEEANAQFNDVENGFDLIDEVVIQIDDRLDNVADQVTNNTTTITQIINGDIQVGGGGGGGAGTTGSILQVVYAETRNQVINTNGEYMPTGLEATITPLSSTSKILVRYNQSMYGYSDAQQVGVAMKAQRNGVDVFDPNASHITYTIGSVEQANQNITATAFGPAVSALATTGINDEVMLPFPILFGINSFGKFNFLADNFGWNIYFSTDDQSIFVRRRDDAITWSYQTAVVGNFPNRRFTIRVFNNLGDADQISFFESPNYKSVYYREAGTLADHEVVFRLGQDAIHLTGDSTATYSFTNSGCERFFRVPVFSASGQYSANVFSTPVTDISDMDLFFGARDFNYDNKDNRRVVTREFVDAPNSVSPQTYRLMFRESSPRTSSGPNGERLFFTGSPLGESYFYTTASTQIIAQYAPVGQGHLSSITLMEISS